jgi:Sugar-transfer associated ATP-grasp
MASGTLRQKFKTFRFLRRRSASVPIGLANKLRMWTHGFLSQSYLIYSFAENDFRDYVSDDVRFLMAVRINGYYAVALYDKLYFNLLLKNFQDYLPETHGLLRDGHLSLLGSGASIVLPDFPDFLRQQGRLVLKPLTGTQGLGVHLLEESGGEIFFDGQPLAADALLAQVKHLQDYLVTGHVRQHPNVARVFPRSTNTVRLMTLWDDEAGAPFVASAVHRFGVARTAPVDSWTRGGVCAAIDLESGCMTKAVPKPLGEAPDFSSCHPESGEPIEGVTIPHWPLIKNRLLDMAAVLHFIPYIAWDVIVTEDGFRVIEANNAPDLSMFQIHGPLLTDPRTRRFFECHVARLSGPGAEARDYKLPFKI